MRLMGRGTWRYALVALLVSNNVACRREPKRPEATPTPNPYPAAWRFHNEEEWIVAQTVEAIAGMAQYASGGKTATPLVASVTRAPLSDSLAPRRFTIRFAPAFEAQEAPLAIDDHIWSPGAYAAIARQVAGPQASPTAAPLRETTDLATSLLDLRVETLERENKRISAGLETHPLDPGLNQEAALLLGAFAIRETGRYFSDARVPISRLAAHLALARIDGEGATTAAGRLAEIALEVLEVRQRAAVALLDAFTFRSPGEQAWARALRLMATGDWRAISNPENASLLERLVYLRALGQRLDVNHAQAFVDKATHEPLTDWRRIMLAGYQGPSVEACNRYTGRGLLEEEAEVLSVWKIHRGANLDAEDWVDALGMDPAPSSANVERGKPEKIHVLDIGLWMAFERRHVSNQLRSDDHCVVEMWGLPALVRKQRKASARNYAGLATYPLVARDQAADAASYRKTIEAVSALLQTRPDLFPAREWVDLMQPGPQGPPPSGLPAYSLWFDPYSPFGTAFDATSRGGYDFFRPRRIADFKTVPPAQAEIAPYDYTLRWRLCQARGGPTSNPTFEVTEAVYRDLAPYDGWALAALAASAKKYSRSEDYRRYVSARCDLIADSCHELADWLVQQGEDEEAARAYRRWVAAARDQVAISNGVDWLVNYDYDHGRKEEAVRLARRAAEVESAGGRLTLARLMEQTGDLLEAEASFRAVFDHYETEPQFLIGFYRRHAGDPRLQPRIRRLEHEIFPDGLARIPASQPPSLPAPTSPGPPPIDGVLIAGTSPAVAEAGLKPGNVIVGLDGYRVQGLKQYNWVRFLAPDDTPMNLAVWNGSQVVDIRAHPKDRWFQADFQDYTPDHHAP